jgi:hypothetical protein
LSVDEQIADSEDLCKSFEEFMDDDLRSEIDEILASG